MAKEHYRDAAPCKLSEFVTPDRFRTVLYEQLHLPGGLTEIPVEIMLKKDTAKKLSFKVPRDGMLYGFARIRPTVKEKFGVENAKLFINDWDDKFVMVFELDDKTEKAFVITADEVVDLLENCIRVPQQRSDAPKKIGKAK
ncbi:MAG: hypothetical protein IK093_13690 [Ruminiclostridium sp.]|nr:hypothetical protein [Ruminiclostridium sp.]